MSAALTRRQHSVYLRMLAEVPGWETMTAREIANALGCQISTADVIQRFGWSFLTCKQQDAEQGIERTIHDTANVVKMVQLPPDYCSQPTPAYGGAISNDGGMDDALLMIALEQSLTPEQYAIVKGCLNGDYMKTVAEKLGISKSAMKYQTRTLAVRLARALGYTMS
jgi:DNA-binding CsgD family transcriptional regulator